MELLTRLQRNSSTHVGIRSIDANNGGRYVCHNVGGEPVCHCGYYFMGPKCDEAFGTYEGTLFTVFVILVFVAQFTFFLFAAVSLWKRWRSITVARYLMVRMTNGTHRSSPGLNWTRRDLSMLVTMLACFLRSAWVFYPTWARTQAWFVADYSFGSLLRVPQVLWYCAFLNLLVAWLSILETAAYASRGRWLRRIALGLIVIGITSTVPVTVLDVVEHVASGWLHTFVNLLCILTGLLILPFGCSVGCRIAHTLQQRQRAKPTASQVDLLNRTTNTIMMTTVVFTSLGLLATSMVAIVTLANFTPQGTPGIFMAYLYLVHLLCEVALAIVLLRASHIGSRKPLGFRRHAVRSVHGWTLRQQRANSNGSSSNSMTGGKYTPPVFFSDMVATTEGRHRSSELSQAHLGSSSEPYHSHSERAVRSSGSLLEPGGAVVVPVRASTRSVSLDSAAQVLVQAEDFHVAGDL